MAIHRETPQRRRSSDGSWKVPVLSSDAPPTVDISPPRAAGDAGRREAARRRRNGVIRRNVAAVGCQRSKLGLGNARSIDKNSA